MILIEGERRCSVNLMLSLGLRRRLWSLWDSSAGSVQGPMGDYYRFACWSTGSAMIFAAMLCTVVLKQSAD
jgi:hypothetical protein